jgi:DNA ligase-1
MWREFRFVRNGKAPLVWMIRQDSESYSTKHGQLDGAMQENSDTPGPKGKGDTKAYVNAVDNCTFHVTREIRKKKEHGYVEYVDGKPTEEQVTEMSFGDYLPKNFCAYKPQTDIKPAALEKLHNKGLARFTRKYDGFCTLMVHQDWAWEVYSRRMDVITNHFPKHVAQLEELDWIKRGTILIGEMLCLKPDGLDDFKATSRVCRSKAPESLALRAPSVNEDTGEELPSECPEPVFIIFDMLYLNGEDLQDKTYDERAINWQINFPTIQKRSGELIVGVDYFNLTPDTWEATAKNNGWEGFVVTDGSAKPGDKFYNFSGKAKRPTGSHKLKPECTEDCVVFAWSAGSGKRAGKVGALWVKQIDPETGHFQNYGKVGSGFTEQDIEYFTNKVSELDIPLVKNDKQAFTVNLEENFDLIIEIKFSERQEDTNKFRFPVFIRERIDKSPIECIANISIKTS